MSAYEQYLLYLSDKLLEINCDIISQEDALFILIKRAMSEQHPMIYEIMDKTGDVVYNDESFIKAAQNIISNSKI